MKPEDTLLRHPRIAIYFPTSREVDAKVIFERYSKLEAFVELRRIKDDRARKHKNCLYSSRKGVRWQKIAEKIAHNLFGIEKLLHRYDGGHSHVEFAIYLQPRTQPQSRRQKTSIRKEPQSESFCHLCSAVFTSKYILKKHLRNAHAVNAKAAKAARIHFWNEETAKVPSIGSPTFRGETVPVNVKTLRRRAGAGICRICNERVPMYNSTECYQCNPK